jgi:putative ABC transport system substrate-binding protein
MRRRDFIAALAGTASLPFAARAQQGSRIRNVAVLNPFAESDREVQIQLAAFRQELQNRGWVEGRNVRIDYRWGNADPMRLRAQAKELVNLRPDVIFAITALALQPLLQETSSIPIVFTRIVEPVSAGFVANLARPGGNVTGFTVMESSTFAKLLEVLKELAPHVTRVGVIYNPDQIPQVGLYRAVEEVAPSFKVEVTPAGARDATEVEQVIVQFARRPNGGLIVAPNPVTEGNRRAIIALAARHRLPAAYVFRHFVADGGLISYGVDAFHQYRQTAFYIDRILQGEQPADLPVQQPTKFELAINLKTAKALGLTVPATMLGRADEVIE